MLDLETIAPEAPAQAATPEVETHHEESQSQEAVSQTQDDGGDFLSHLSKVIDDAEKGVKQGESEVPDAATDNEKPESVSTDSEDELETPEMTAAVKKMSMKSAEAFNKIKANANQKIADLKAKLQEVEAKAQTPVNDSKIEELNAAIKAKEEALSEATRKLAFHDVTETPEYVDAVTKPTQIIRSKIAELAQAYEIQESDFIKAITEKNPKTQRELLREISQGMDDFDKPALYDITKDFANIVATESMLRENAVKAWEEVKTKRQQEQETQKIQLTQEQQKIRGEVWNKLSEKIPMIKELEPDKLKAQFDSTDFDSMKPTDKIGALAAAVSFVPLVRKFMDQVASKDAKIKELETAMKKYVKSSPGAGSGTSTQVAPSSDDGIGFLEAIERRINGG